MSPFLMRKKIIYAASLLLINISFIPLGTAQTLSSALKNSSLTSAQKAAHVMDRLAFGGRPGEVEKLQAGGNAAIQKWIERQLNPDSVSDQNTIERLEKLKSLSLSSSELIAKYPKPGDVAKEMGIDSEKFKTDESLKKIVREKIGEEHLPERIVDEMRAQKIMRAVESKRQLQEVLDDFWFNHFNVDIKKNEIKYLLISYERDSLRPHLFGKFIDLLRASAHSPAMLMYLDNSQSQSALFYPQAKINKDGKTIQPPPRPRDRGLNENYARELLELHTLGVDGGYTQSDVTELARILTGWGIAHAKEDPQFEFNEKVHDRGQKLFLGKVFAENRGEDEGEEALTLISRQPATAKHIATLLTQLFVSDHPSDQLIKKVTSRYLVTDGDLKAVYLEIFSSPEFWSKPTYRAKIKMPFHLIVSTVRALGGEVEINSKIPNLLNAMGEDLYSCAPPTGYRDQSEFWVNSGAMVSRLNATLQLSLNTLPGVYTVLPRFSRAPPNTTELIREVSSRLLHDPLAKGTENVINDELKDELISMSDGEVRPLTTAKTVGLVLGSPEFQRH